MAITTDNFGTLEFLMETGGEVFEIRRDEGASEARGLANREQATQRRYIGFEPETDVAPGDLVVGRTSGNAFTIIEVERQVVEGKVFQVKAFCQTTTAGPRKSASLTDSAASAEHSPGDKARVFVVHGRNERARRAMFEFLRSIDLKPLEWSQAIRLTGKASPYVGEILDAAFSNAQAIVVLMTGDDEVRLRPALLDKNDPRHERELTPQARPNVLFEAGMALGRHPDRTLLVELGPLRPFSDVGGRHTVRLTNSSGSRQDVASRLDGAGCPVNLSGRDWHAAGDFEAAVADCGNVSQDDTSEPLRTDRILAEEWVSADYPDYSGLIARMSRDGYEVSWAFESQLMRRCTLEGWELVAMGGLQGERSTLRLRDRPENQTLLRRKIGLKLRLVGRATGNPPQDVVTLMADGRPITDVAWVAAGSERRSVPQVAPGGTEVNLRFTGGMLQDACTVCLVNGEEKTLYI